MSQVFHSGLVLAIRCLWPVAFWKTTDIFQVQGCLRTTLRRPSLQLELSCVPGVRTIFLVCTDIPYVSVDPDVQELFGDPPRLE